MTRRIAIAMILATFLSIVVMASLSGRESGADRSLADPAECGMPPAKAEVKRAARLPELVRFRGGRTIAFERSRGFDSADIYVPLSVRELFDTLRSRVRASDYRVLQQDFEGFEAELYITIGNTAGALQIIGSECPGLSRLLVQLPAKS